MYLLVLLLCRISLMNGRGLLKKKNFLYPQRRPQHIEAICCQNSASVSVASNCTIQTLLYEPLGSQVTTSCETDFDQVGEFTCILLV